MATCRFQPPPQTPASAAHTPRSTFANSSLISSHHLHFKILLTQSFHLIPFQPLVILSEGKDLSLQISRPPQAATTAAELPRLHHESWRIPDSKIRGSSRFG